MLIDIRQIDLKALSKLKNEHKLELPIWISPDYLLLLKSVRVLLAYSGDVLKGIWAIPLKSKQNDIVATRHIRLFPYSSPLIFETSNLKKQEVFQSFLRYLMSFLESISLPMSPDFTNISIFQFMGGYIEWRHTHMLFDSIPMSKLSSRLRNHITNAKKKSEIYLSTNPKYFNFELAIKGNREDISTRKKLAIRLLKDKKALIYYGVSNDKIVGGVFIVYNRRTVILYHSWHSKDAPRGLISYIILESINRTFINKDIEHYDFEGSVIKDIDYFFLGFNARIVPYGYLLWHKDQAYIPKMLNNSLNIPGRKSII